MAAEAAGPPNDPGRSLRLPAMWCVTGRVLLALGCTWVMRGEVQNLFLMYRGPREFAGADSV